MRDTFLKPMHPEGRKFVAIFGAVTVLLFLIHAVLGWIGVGLTIWCYYFFRDPERVQPDGDTLVLSPADGVVSLIERVAPPPELNGPTHEMTRVSVFMSVFTCHVNRLPVTGEVTAIAYRSGKFFNASLDKASTDNERNSLLVRMPDGRDLVVVQIAGLVARRIVSFIEPGARLVAGERFGLIRFGSRLDIYLPEGVEPVAKLGQTMVAGETVIAHLGTSQNG
jgi:phosphatidylserine decarboxylase